MKNDLTDRQEAIIEILRETKAALVHQPIEKIDEEATARVFARLMEERLQNLESAGIIGKDFQDFVVQTVRFYKNRKRENKLLNEFVPTKLTNIGSVKELTILPLSEWLTDPPLRNDTGTTEERYNLRKDLQLTTEADVLVPDTGPSFLIKADETVILFDTGFNRFQVHPSPVLRNMNKLGVNIKDIQYIVISHLHPDHVGGYGQVDNHTFVISPSEGEDLSHIKEVFTPVPMVHPTAKKVTTVDAPCVIAPGVASEGPIGRALFYLSSGFVREQALGVNVEGKGIVLIVGCGHQGVERIIGRAEQIHDEPIYGLAGGLHYPVTSGRSMRDGRETQTYRGTGKPPWERITKSDVRTTIEYLKSKNLSLVSLSGHDSCDWSLDAFRKAFSNIYQECAVGHTITV
jgi:7,8-dihydropterin-6-yl-methyl-4-(beta-D-ribofuranosyl)aminobenzene 5'-phosphate synthase